LEKIIMTGIFNLGHGFLPDIDHKKVQNTVKWIKEKNWNR